MKKLLLAVILIGCCLSIAKGQIRHVQGMKALELNGLYTDLGVGGTAGYLMYLPGKLSLVGLISFDGGKEVNKRSAMGMIVDVGVGYSLSTFGSDIFINVYGGGSVSYDDVANAESYDVGNGINYGVFVTPELEYFINDTFSILGKAPVRYLFSNAFGGLRVQGSLGLRYNF